MMMRLLISVRCARIAACAQQPEGIARYVASVVEAAHRHDDVHLVFDAALGQAIDVIRNATGVIAPQCTRVWGGVGEGDESVLDGQEVRALRLRRCIAEFEPDAVIDICLGQPAEPVDLQALLPIAASMHGAGIDDVSTLVQAISGDALDAVRDRLPAGYHLSVQIAERTSTDRAFEDVHANHDIATRGLSGSHRLAIGPSLDNAILQLLRSSGYVQIQGNALQALPDHLTLDTTLQLAHACGGYDRLRKTLSGEALPIADVEAWLASVARGARGFSADDPWHVYRRVLDSSLVRSLGDAAAVPAVAAALRSDLLAPVAGPRRLLVDISALVKFDAKSGIQRVVRNILTHLEAALPKALQITPIAFMDDGRCVHVARFYARFVDLPYDLPGDLAFVPRPGDIFLGLDLSAHIVPVHQAKFEWLRRLGIPIHFVVYDLLPVRRPECFDPRVVNLFQAWYASVATLADGVLCISRAVADEFADWLDENRPKRIGALDIGYFHLGADIVDAAQLDASTPHPLSGRSYVLMVSTLEPRKGYAQALDAFERIWAQGIDLSLVIVGKQGWMMEALVGRLRGHAELGHRLHWFEGIEDALLASLYEHADVLLSASEGEGFGLPLIEAAQYGVPVLCRDLPVFREIAGNAASYFSSYDPQVLANAIVHWRENPAARPTVRIPWKTWREATAEFVATLTTDLPYRRWLRNEDRQLFSGYNPRLQTLAGERSHGDIVTTGREGILLYGPYTMLPAGTYRLRVYGELSVAARAMLLEVVAVEASQQVATWHVTASAHDLILDAEFHLPGDVEDLEVRAAVSSLHVARISGIEIVRRPIGSTQHPVENQRNSEERVQ